MSVGVAHADPAFVISESQVRAGDTVHFSISGAEGRVTYEIEVADRDVLKGAGDDGAASGQFTMPDFGATAKQLKVEADIRDSDDETEVKRTLQYLGAALPPPAAAPPPQVAPTVPQQAAAAPAFSPAFAAPAPPAAKAPVAKHRSKGKARKHTRKRRRAKRHRPAMRRDREHKREAPVKTRKRARPPAPRTAPLFDGVPESGSERYSPDDEQTSQPKKNPAHASVFGNAAAGRGSTEPATAILIPGLMGLGGFLLAAAVVVRQRRNR
jgi:hypothetical protein